MPTNLYGINDRFDVNHGHVIPGLINKFLEAKETNAESIECWGTGTPTREFLFSDDLADALIYLMNNHDYIELINVGIDNEITIRELAEKIRVLVGYGGQIVWNSDKPDGTPRRKMCNDKLKSLGWSPKYSLDDGLKLTLDWYLKNKGEIQ
jgi:GDP-L-fucose synthase